MTVLPVSAYPIAGIKKLVFEVPDPETVNPVTAFFDPERFTTTEAP